MLFHSSSIKVQYIDYTLKYASLTCMHTHSQAQEHVVYQTRTLSHVDMTADALQNLSVILITLQYE